MKDSLIKKYTDKFDGDERYSSTDKAITKLFFELERNTVLEDIILKICVVNELYGKNIYSILKLFKHILNSNIDEKLIAGNLNVVSKIAKGYEILTKK